MIVETDLDHCSKSSSTAPITEIHFSIDIKYLENATEQKYVKHSVQRIYTQFGAKASNIRIHITTEKLTF